MRSNRRERRHHDRFDGVHPVFRFIEDYRACGLEHLFRDLQSLSGRKEAISISRPTLVR